MREHFGRQCTQPQTLAIEVDDHHGWTKDGDEEVGGGGVALDREVADVSEKDVWDFQAKSGSSGSCRLFLRALSEYCFPCGSLMRFHPRG